MTAYFWVGSTGNWDTTTTTNWATSSGGAGGAGVPGAADSVTFDGSSGGGTVTVMADLTVTNVTISAFTGTLDFAANNHNITISGAFTDTGTAAHTLNMGNGTWTLSGLNPWDTTNANLTQNPNGSTVNLTGNSNALSFTSTGNKSFNILTFPSIPNSYTINVSGPITVATLNFPTKGKLSFSAATITITNAFSIAASEASPLLLECASGGSQFTFSCAGACTASWAVFRNCAFTGGGSFVASNSFSIGNNSGITINNPATSGGGVFGS